MTPLRITGLFLLLLALVVLPLLALPQTAQARISSETQSEIRHLLSYVEQSGCLFYRNGVWHRDTKAARQHLERKYNYFAGKGRIRSAEDFIESSATKSEITGKPYLVRCGNGEALPLSQWLFEELERYRKAS